MKEKVKLTRPILVEGRYDKAKLSAVAEGVIIVSNGFAILNNKEKLTGLRKIANEGGLYIMTDSDAAGMLLRHRIADFVGHENVVHIFTKDVVGKERRKSSKSKQGKLGVEGMEADYLRGLLLLAQGNEKPPDLEQITTAVLLEDKITGDGSRARRLRLMQLLEIPSDINTKGLLGLINTRIGGKKYRDAVDRINKEVKENGFVRGTAYYKKEGKV